MRNAERKKDDRGQKTEDRWQKTDVYELPAGDGMRQFIYGDKK